MIDYLEKDELSFAFHSEFSPTNYWKTTKEKRILTLPNEKDYYFY
ncbi:hypothetical protein [uncultured Lutibacter sp.]|nr:hypothetical protein [uncultured Lutibacter sp.]